MQIGYSGRSAGQIIGYAGETGDTATPHLHFEWHPNVIPEDWPPSLQPATWVIGGAINLFPLLVQVCRSGRPR